MSAIDPFDMKREQLIAENERLRAELAEARAATGRHASRSSATEAVARKAYNAALAAVGVSIDPSLNAKPPEDVRRGFWYSALMAGISINVMARVSHAHHSKVRAFVRSIPQITLTFRTARDAAAQVFKEEAQRS